MKTLQALITIAVLATLAGESLGQDSRPSRSAEGSSTANREKNSRTNKSVSNSRDENRNRRSRSKPRTTTKALLSAFESEQEVRSDAQSLDDVASEVSAVLSKVDRGNVGKLQDRLDDLSRQEAQIQRALADLDRGLPVPVSVTRELEATAKPTSLESLQGEKEILVQLKGELERQRLQRVEARRRAEQLEAARRPTRSTRALLTALGELPELNNDLSSIEAIPVASTPFPRKLADALYRAGDYRGALRLYREAEKSESTQLDSKERYRVARCEEWLGNIEAAQTTLKTLLKAQPDESDFWHQRAKSYLDYLMKTPEVKRVLEGGTK